MTRRSTSPRSVVTGVLVVVTMMLLSCAPGLGTTAWGDWSASIDTRRSAFQDQRWIPARGAVGLPGVVASAAALVNPLAALAGALSNWDADTLQFYPLHQAQIASRDLASGRVGMALETTESTWFTVRFESLRSRIDRPVEGVVLHSFGPRMGPAPNTSVRHPGITYRVAPEQQVRAIAQGRVEFAGQAEGYQYVVILNHGDGYHSVYAGLGQASVSAGSVIAVSAEVGTTTAVQGATLHFEIRRFGEALNPSEWMAPQAVSSAAL